MIFKVYVTLFAKMTRTSIPSFAVDGKTEKLVGQKAYSNVHLGGTLDNVHASVFQGWVYTTKDRNKSINVNVPFAKLQSKLIL